MNTEEKLIEELKKGNWIIDPYKDSNRVAALHSILRSCTGTALLPACFHLPPELLVSTENNDVPYFQQPTHEHNDLTQLFNEYLEEFRPRAWMHSVLAAMQIGEKVECRHQGSQDWFIQKDWVIDFDAKYRINYKEPDLVPDEIWDIISTEYQYIVTESEEGAACAFTNRPHIESEFDMWISDGGLRVDLSHLKWFNNPDCPFYKINWEDSLYVRPNKKDS